MKNKYQFENLNGGGIVNIYAQSESEAWRLLAAEVTDHVENYFLIS